MRKGISLLFTFLPLVAIAQVQDWENHHILEINREPARSAFLPYQQKIGDSQLSLNGIWKFKWTKNPELRIKDFYRVDFNDKSWKTLNVPANWEMNGYGTPLYMSAGYTFKIAPPYVTQSPKKDWTTYEERNPTGQYRRTFMLPVSWKQSGQTAAIIGVSGFIFQPKRLQIQNRAIRKLRVFLRKEDQVLRLSKKKNTRGR